MEPFDLCGDLPRPGGTTLLEASAGTGKTYTLAGLVTRYVAEGEARLEEMLLITFGRAASNELRSRVREQLRDAERALAADDDGGGVPLLEHLVARNRAADGACLQRIRDALADFDAATIATTHQFCGLVLDSLGVAGDTDSGVRLVENLGDLLGEVVDDLYLARFSDTDRTPTLSREAAGRLAGEVVGQPHTTLLPTLEESDPTSPEGLRVRFAHDVLAELERRKRRLGILGYDDLLTRLADALEHEESPARVRMRQRWRIVMVDEFQDTDPIQWDVIRRAFVGHATVVLIGDPKQAIYAFRGGDVATYLRAAAECDVRQTLATNHRSDAALVDALGVLMGGAALGDPRIVVHDVEARQQGSRLDGPDPTRAFPVRLRLVGRDRFGVAEHRTVPIADVREHIAEDLAADIRRQLADGVTHDGRPLEAGHLATLVESHREARICRDALARAGVPAVYPGDSDVFSSAAAEDWTTLLEALDAPHRSGLVRAAAATRFFGYTAQELYDGGDRLTERVGETLRRWTDGLRRAGPVAVYEAARIDGMAKRVLSHRFGERHLTDLAHLAQLLHDAAHREQMGIPALLDWLRSRREERAAGDERLRRLDSDAEAVQIMTVWVSKGLEFPVVYLPFVFDRGAGEDDELLFHDADGRRCLDIGGKGSPSYSAHTPLTRAEQAGEVSRLLYVALTRAQSQVVTWWAPTYNEAGGSLSRMLRGRGPGEAEVLERLEGPGTDAEMAQYFAGWKQRGGLALEPSAVAEAPSTAPLAPTGPLSARIFARTVDLGWRRTSYSGLLRAAAEAAGQVTSEPETEIKDDEGGEAPAEPPAATPDSAHVDHVPSPLDGFAAGAGFGSLVHAVLEHADPAAGDLRDRFAALTAEQAPFWGYDGDADELADALLPSQQTPLGPLCGDLTLAGLGFADRLRELDFEIPLAGGDRPHAGELRLADLAPLLVEHLPADDPLRPYADRLADPVLGAQSLRGYLSGSIDVVLRVPTDGGEPRFVVADYKTNRLGPEEQPITTAAYTPQGLAEAMLHSDYPLQALLYAVVLHRYLRWRLPGYRPEIHLGGVVYLYLRGMAGPDTPTIDGHPTGVFSWPVPPALVVAVSDLLDAGATEVTR